MSSKFSPDHYTTGRIETWDFIIDKELDFLLGNVIKYVVRAGKKDNESRQDDLIKAATYIRKAIETDAL